MYKKLSAAIIVLAMICVSFAAVSLTVPAEAVHGPFELKTGNWPTTAVDYPDQMQLTPDDLWQMNGYNYLTQEFWPSQTAVIPRVDIWLQYLSGTGFLDVSICTWAGGPQTILDSTTVTWDQISPTGDWLVVEFFGSVTLTVGIPYGIILQVSSLDFYWIFGYSDPYPPGAGYYYDAGIMTLPSMGDYMFVTYYEDYIPATLDKVAWAGNGKTALAVDGMTSHLYEFTRETGMWSDWGEWDSGSEFNDIVYSPVYDIFFIVGQSSGTFADAWAYSYTMGWYDFPPACNGMFHGVEYAQAGEVPYIFVAVGECHGAPNEGLIAWYDDPGLGWYFEIFADGGGIQNNDVIYDVAYNSGGTSYYCVGQDGATGYGVVYYVSAPLGGAYDLGHNYIWTPLNMLKAIDWCPGGSYGIMVGYNVGVAGNVYKYDGSPDQPVPIHDGTETFHDVDWYPAGDIAVIVGQHGANGVVLNHIANSNEVVDLSSKLPASTGPLYGVACKAATSPRSAIILSAGGAIGAFPQAQDINTQIRVNSAFPHIFSIDMWDQASAGGTLNGPSLLNTEVDVGAVYTFKLEANYSIATVNHWYDSEIELTAWYDEGHTFGASVPDGSFGTPDNRTRQFRIYYNALNDTAWMTYPVAPALEFTIAALDWYCYPTPATADHYSVYLNVSFGQQTYAADGATFGNGPAVPITDINFALNDPFSWDFNYTIYDQNFSSAFESAYEEFGIKQAVSITAGGNPTGNAPPGSSNIPLFPSSTITYSANANNWVNVSIPDLVGPATIPAGNVDVLNANAWNATDSDIWAWTPMPGVGNYVCVWGHDGPAVPLTPVLNGTQSAGPVVSDYTWLTGFVYPSTTTVSWRVTVPFVPEGVYLATITFTVESL